MAARQRSDFLTREWNRPPDARTPWPGTQREFLAFFQTTKKKFIGTHFALFDTLSGAKQKGIISLGGTVRFAGTPVEKFTWTFRCTRTGPFWNAGETFIGQGKTQKAAATRALLVLWELTVRRQQQG